MLSKSRAQDTFYLKKTLLLAKKGLGWTNPNPLVGAVVVKNGKIVGLGYHKKVGGPHAEIEAFKNAKNEVKGATLYVNLEPCSYFGRTPPCAGAIIRNGIKRVVCCTLDPNPKVSGRGIKKLESSGVKTSVGLLANEAMALNETFMFFQKHKRPFVAIKFAASLDGKIATRTNDSKWISNSKARDFTRSLRGQYQAILVGANTVIKDNPHLGASGKKAKDPLRVVLDGRLQVSPSALVFRDRNAIVFTGSHAGSPKLRILREKGIEVIQFPFKNTPIHKLLAELAKRQIISLLVEGGGGVLGNFVDSGLVDKVYAVHAPIIIGGDKAINAVRGLGAKTVSGSLHLMQVSFKSFGDNMLTIGYAKR